MPSDSDVATRAPTSTPITEVVVNAIITSPRPGTALAAGQPAEVKGLAWDGGTFFWSTNVNYQDEAYFADVLNVRAFVDSFTQINAAIGVRLLDEYIAANHEG